MTQAKANDTVLVHYTGKLADGTVFDTSVNREPLEFEVGTGQVIPGFESAVIGMNEGETKTVTIPQDQAYGERRDDLIVDIARESFPPEPAPQPGMDVQLRTQSGQTIQAVIVGVSDGAIKVDANHPLAGRDLTFELELVSVR